MTITHHSVSTHLNYFLCLEDDLLQLSRWIEFSTDNEPTYSIELARLLMTATGEVDVVAKSLCKAIDKKCSADNIRAYQTVLLNAVPILPQSKVDMPRFGMTFQPWSSWATKGNSPDWWQGNNNVKHHRTEHFHQANLKNVLNASAALLILLLLLHSKDGPYFPQQPRLFVPRTFATNEGPVLRLLIPDGTNLPWG